MKFFQGDDKSVDNRVEFFTDIEDLNESFEIEMNIECDLPRCVSRRDQYRQWLSEN